MIFSERDFNLYRDLRCCICDHGWNHFDFRTFDGENVEQVIRRGLGFSGGTTWHNDISCSFVRYVFSILLQHAGAEELKTRECHHDENDHRNSHLDRGSTGATICSSL